MTRRPPVKDGQISFDLRRTFPHLCDFVEQCAKMKFPREAQYASDLESSFHTLLYHLVNKDDKGEIQRRFADDRTKVALLSSAALNSLLPNLHSMEDRLERVWINITHINFSQTTNTTTCLMACILYLLNIFIMEARERAAAEAAESELITDNLAERVLSGEAIPHETIVKSYDTTPRAAQGRHTSQEHIDAFFAPASTKDPRRSRASDDHGGSGSR